MKLNRLNAKQLTASALEGKDARLNDGGGLGLLPNYKGNAGQHRWVFNGTLAGGKRFEMGLGTLAEVTLAAARTLAVKARQDVAAGIDPRAVRVEGKAAAAQAADDARRA